MKRALLGLVLLIALTAPGHASAATPVPWCGSGESATDRTPDATPGFSVHMIYAYPTGSPNRFAQLVPRFVGDATAIDAWWRGQDASRAPRFDLAAFPCTTPFGPLDVSSVELPTGVGAIGSAFNTIAAILSSRGFSDPTKEYIVYFDGPTAQSGQGRICGQGAPGTTDDDPGYAVIYLDSCAALNDDVLRPVVVAHELIHVLGAVSLSAPHVCESGHVCGAPNDLMTASVNGLPLESQMLDVGRDDYYGHNGTWLDVQDALILERIDSADRLPPSAVPGLTASGTIFGSVTIGWGAASDDAGPVRYRVTLDGRLAANTTGRTARAFGTAGETVTISVRAADAAGHLGPPTTILYKVGLGIVDASGALVRDTVRPTSIGTTRVVRTSTKVTLSWKPARDLGGLKGYRVQIGTQTTVVTSPTITLARAALRGAISVAALDRAGNAGPATAVPLSRLR